MAHCAWFVRAATCLVLLTAVAASLTPAAAPAAGFPRLGSQGSSRAVLTPRQKDDYQYDYEAEEQDEEDYDDYYDYGTKKKKKPKPPGGAGGAVAASSGSETNVFNFFRIAILRLVWGVASLFGFEEPLSEAFNGAFVPPGVDDYDEDGLGLEGDYRDYF